jgi:hypothetical protein
MRTSLRIGLCLLECFSARTFSAEPASGGDSSAELAKKLANPVSSLISMPFQFNYDENIGEVDNGERITLNIQPVIPTALNDEWNLISRTILPVIDQSDIFPGAGSQSGIGDITQSLFFSPKAPTPGGVLWGVGPVLLIPTASDELLGSGKWGAGPTLVAVKQSGHWTYGGLLNHIWSVGGDRDRAAISSTFLQPFLSYSTPKAVTYTVNIEGTYDWESSETGIPLNASMSKVMKIGSLNTSLGASLRYWLDSTPTGPEGFGLRFTFTMVFPR